MAYTNYATQQGRMAQQQASDPMKALHKVRQTAAAAITLPRGGLALLKVKIIGHATAPTALSILYNGIARAIFPCGPGAQKEFLLKHPVGINLPATWAIGAVVASKTGGTTTLTAPTAWELTFGPLAMADPNAQEMETFRGVVGLCAVADSGTAFGISYDEMGETMGGAVPIAALAYMTGGVAGANAQWAFPVIGSISPQIESAGGQNYLPEPEPLPQYPPALTVVVTPAVSGAATTAVVVVYY